MKKIYKPFILFCLLQNAAFAQQEQMYTQFMFNKQLFNPAHAGNFESPTLTAIHRQQWVGLEGAPNASLISFSLPTNSGRVGFGGVLSRQSVAITSTVTLDLAYAYRIPLRRGYLAMALQMSLRSFSQDWSDERIRWAQENDMAIPTGGRETRLVPNPGAGLYYQGYKWYFGFAAPRILSQNVDFAETGDIVTRALPHYNTMGGVDFTPAEGLKITTQAMLRYVKGAPFDGDLNVSAEFKERFFGGLTYRFGGNRRGLGESICPLVGMQATDKLFMCLSYDLGLSRLRKLNYGSAELIVRWWFNPPEGDAGGTPVNPN
jgi:type IX secretion system PorP/SprF family membrane protein